MTNNERKHHPDFAYAGINFAEEAEAALEAYNECCPPSIHTYIDEVEEYLYGCKLDLRFQYANLGNAEDEEDAKMYEEIIDAEEKSRRKYEIILSYLYQAREATRELYMY